MFENPGTKNSTLYMAPTTKRRPLKKLPNITKLDGSVQKLGALFRGPYNKDHDMLGSIFRGPLFLETPIYGVLWVHMGPLGPSPGRGADSEHGCEASSDCLSSDRLEDQMSHVQNSLRGHSLGAISSATMGPVLGAI